jgi:hypothetical protein
MFLGKLDIHMQKNENRPILSLKQESYKNKDKCRSETIELLEENRKNFMMLMWAVIFLDINPKAQTMKANTAIKIASN